MATAQVLEVKRTVDGRMQTFWCTLLRRTPAWIAIRYVLPRAATVGSLTLPPGAETIAHFWPDRPYVAYHWLDADGRTLGIYVNAASDVEITDEQVRWRDLALDLLVLPDGHVEVLDDDEAQRAPSWAQPRIERARAALSDPGAIAREVETLTASVRSAPAAAESGSP